MIQLKIRTEYSFGQTFCPVEKAIAYLKEKGCVAAGIVDQGSTWGHTKWFKKCKEAGVQPLLGVELVVTDIEDTSPRMWFLAKNLAGLQELYRWASKTYQQPMPSKRGQIPALRRADVRKMSRNIIKFAGDIVDEEFLTEIGATIDISPASRVLAAQKRGIAERNGLRIVGVGDNAYLRPEDKPTFELIGGGMKPTPQHVLLDLEWQDTAAEIAAECAELALPKAPMIRAEGDIEALCREGIKFRNMEHSWSDEYETRLKYELGLIKEKDFESYFLIVADMMIYAKSHMLVGPARGSSAGSLVCWLMRITEVDPIPPGLIFERFIDISRSDLPDIDTDFPDDKRHLVFEYMAEKYGSGNVGHIGTISQYKPKSALIQVCKKLRIPPAATGAVKVAMIERSSADSRANNCLEDTFTQTDPGKAFLKSYPAAISAIALEGHASHTGVHAAGLLISNDPITNYATVDDNGIAHIDKLAAEDLGLLKIDVLGLRTLGILEDCGIDIDWYSLPFDDQKTYDLFNSGRFCGIFQFDGNALRAVSGRVKFEKLSDIDAVTALARPGPFGGGVTTEYCDRKAGKSYKPMHPAIDKHMSATYGLPVYQETIMNIVRHVGGFSWKDTSTIRKTMSKRLGKEFFDKHFETFKIGAMAKGIEEKEAREVWDMINSFGAWCLSGETLINMASPNQSTPALVKLKDLAKTGGRLNPQKPEKTAKIFSMFGGESCTPTALMDCFPSGEKETLELKLESGNSIRATKDHKFYTKRGWVKFEDITLDDEVGIMLKRAENYKFTKKYKGIGSGAHNRWSGDGHSKEFLRKIEFLKREFRICQSCLSAPYEETHHVDGDRRNNSLQNLIPVCRKCHKKFHFELDGKLPVSYEKGNPVDFSKVFSIGSPKIEQVYDISMPSPAHNFVANGVIVHNCFNQAHSHSYSVVSYWTAYLKAHHPLEFAACNLRNAKDEDSAVELLREMVKEGIEYRPFDIDNSEMNWSVKDNKLLGGFVSLKGIGETKAAKLIEARKNGTLTAKQRKELAEASSVFTDIFPFQTKYKAVYEDPASANIAGNVCKIEDITEGIPHGEDRVFIAELVTKNQRDANEDVNVKKRGGKLETGQLIFVDVRLRDDSGQIGGRIGRREYLSIGKELLESVPIGTHLLVRAKFFNGIRYAFIQKYKVLS